MGTLEQRLAAYAEQLKLSDEAQKSFTTTMASIFADELGGPPLHTQPADFEERYLSQEPIARGGMGEIWRVYDKKLQRVVVRKTMRPDIPARLRHRFQTEVWITSQLHHPGIIPVHDTGTLPDGRLWYTMPEVHGQTLSVLIREIHHAPDKATARERFQRFVTVFQQVCAAVAYAHSQGVIHRDLKPANIMLGSFGEVFVLDWGVARARDVDALQPGRPIAGAAHATQAGSVIGTPAYMSPEQAAGDLRALTPATDVYALGAILYQALSNQPPFRGSLDAVLQQVRTRSPRPLGELVPAELHPSQRALVAVCQSAMRRDPELRCTMDAMLTDLAAWLSGARRRTEAEALVTQADALAAETGTLRAEIRALRDEAQGLLDRIAQWEPVEKKRPGWAAQDRATQLERAHRLRELQVLENLYSALKLVPDLGAAHDRLAQHYLGRLQDAEARRDAGAVAEMEYRLRQHDRRNRFAGFIRGIGALTLHTDPPGASVALYRYARVERRLQPVFERQLGQTPLVALPLKQGSYELRISAPGYAETRYPVFISRGAAWDGVPPGGTAPHPVPLLRPEALGPEDVYVPAGRAIFGGDPGAWMSRARHWAWVDGFIVRRFQITHQQYTDYLHALLSAGCSEDEVVALFPVSTRSTEPMYQLGADGITLQHTIGLEWPVTGLSRPNAARFCAWQAQQTGLPWRLPGVTEWEKAARGVDGRFFPWGDFLDPTWCNMAYSRNGASLPTSVRAHPEDESPYGVRGVAGNARDFCAGAYENEGVRGVDGNLLPQRDASLCPVRGGHFRNTGVYCRLASRVGLLPKDHSLEIGFRMARDLLDAQKSEPSETHTTE